MQPTSPQTTPPSGASAYFAQVWTVAANSVLHLPIAGSFLACLTMSLTSAAIQIDGAQSQFFQQGMVIRAQPGAQFKNIVLDNSANASPLTVNLAWGQGSILLTPTALASISGGGNTALVNADGQLEIAIMGGATGIGTNTMLVSSDGTAGVRVYGGTLGSPVKLTNPAMNALPQSAAAGQPQVQPGGVGGSDYNASAAAGATTIVAPASNVNGVVIRGACLVPNTGTVGIFAGTSAPTTLLTNQAVFIAAGTAQMTMPREILLPAGQGVYLYNNGAAAQQTVNYDIL
jgi:hypothetical protein